MSVLGAIACGHSETAAAAEDILRAGGNAFDAIVAAHFSACVAEPVLASLGGGGFLLARTCDGSDIIYDFFAQTPQRKSPADQLGFYPIHADFGTTTQEFHIGPGAIATPGSVKGMFAIQRELGTMPMTELVQPAIHLARQGMRINNFQAYLFNIIKPILLATPQARALYADPRDPTQIMAAGQVLKFTAMADAMEVLAKEGDALFYRGEIAQEIVRLCRQGGGHLTAEDLENYTVIKRKPLQLNYRGTRISTNPPPSSGGILIGFALKLLDSVALDRLEHGSPEHLQLLSQVMALTNKARIDAHIDGDSAQLQRLLDKEYMQQYQQQIYQRSASLRGTTHISVMDRHGNLASMTISNGEGCGHVIPDTDIMLNNMLGEEDLNPHGFQQWHTNQRMTSMMAPSAVLFPDGRHMVIGSGGSNRLRTAILQVLVNIIDYGMPVEAAVQHPRIHHEAGLLSLEQGLPHTTINTLAETHPQHKLWPELNLFFGGTHCVMQQGNEFSGTGDPRRGGVALVVEG